MTEQHSPGWQPPEQLPGPAPGFAYGDFGPRLIAYIIDVLIVIGVVIALAIAWAILTAVTGGFANNAISSGAAGGVVLLAIIVPVVTIGYWVSGAVFYLGYVWILVDKRRRGWHDLIAGTVVIKQV